MIKLTNLTRYFGTLAAVNAVSFSVGKGEVFGLLGPNGAGKTTTIRMLTTLLTTVGRHGAGRRATMSRPTRSRSGGPSAWCRRC